MNKWLIIILTITKPVLQGKVLFKRHSSLMFNIYITKVTVNKMGYAEDCLKLSVSGS